ncbi:chitinase-3-like protein 1 [Lingula anatina]|uniref:Chitinase-3-like protein 1 n=1 Tax=Lingula anatina TaxID=7574 RepID=A0A1S3IYR9_LINAN|nr:chitinase-3-like protein 1 [Lingula anatina]|eukprot:XP_013402694.1 chitinase-3-like protein 1 [Lingula anatina]
MLSEIRVFVAILLLWGCVFSSLGKDHSTAGRSRRQTSVVNQRRVCFYGGWSRERLGAGRFDASFINGTLCTHVVYAFAKIVNGIMVPDNNDSAQEEVYYAELQAVRNQYPHLKILLSVGGWLLGSGPFSSFARNYSQRLTFASHALADLRRWGFDGLDVNWEYPGSRYGSSAMDKVNYVELLKDIYFAFEVEGMMTGLQRLLLTATVPAGRIAIDNGFNIPEISNWLDFVIIMTYDYHGSWLHSPTGHNAPLYPEEQEVNKELNVDWSVMYWIKHGYPPEHIVLGLAAYGRTYTLYNGNWTHIGAPAAGGGGMGDYTKTDGINAYYEICSKLDNGYSLVWNDAQKVHYAFNNQTMDWVGFDSPKSIAIKTKYAMSLGLGGIMMWSLDLDDFGGSFCNQSQYPLLTAAYLVQTSNLTVEAVEKIYPMDGTVYQPKVRPECTLNFTCPEIHGLYPHPCPDSCDRFIHCAFYRPNEKMCPPGLLYSKELQWCEYPWMVTCTTF